MRFREEVLAPPAALRARAPPRAQQRSARHGAVRERVAQLAGPTHAVAVALRIRARDDAGAFDADPPANQRYDIADRAGVRPRPRSRLRSRQPRPPAHPAPPRAARRGAPGGTRPLRLSAASAQNTTPSPTNAMTVMKVVSSSSPYPCGAGPPALSPPRTTRRAVAASTHARRTHAATAKGGAPKPILAGSRAAVWFVRRGRFVFRAALVFFFFQTLRDAPPAYTPRRA